MKLFGAQSQRDEEKLNLELVPRDRHMIAGTEERREKDKSSNIQSSVCVNVILQFGSNLSANFL